MHSPAQTANIQAQIDRLLPKAETGEQFAEIARLEAVMLGGPFWCPTCGVELSAADTIPCELEYGEKCGVELIDMVSA